MTKDGENYYTAGELAEIFGMTKQTLLYYDKIGILKPEFISANNYRHYSINQYMLLEIIITLRKLDVSLNEIKEYIEKRNPEKLHELLLKKQVAYNEQIRIAQEANAKISCIMKKINHASHEHICNILLEHRHKKKVIIAKLNGATNSKELVTIYARHNLKLFDAAYFVDKATGWIIAKDNYFSGDKLTSIGYYTIVDGEYSGSDSQYLPSGLYLSAHFKGIFHTRGKELVEYFNQFLQRNKLRVIGDIYCMPIVDHWLTDNPQDYVTRITMQVEYIDSNL